MEFLRRLLRRRPASDPLGPEPEISPDELDAELKAWSIVDLQNPEEGEYGVVRVRTVKPEHREIAAFKTAVSIRWPYDPSSPFPSDEAVKGMADFEKAIDALTWMNGFSELVLVTTGQGAREWLFYTRDYDRFMATFNALLAGHETFPVQIEFDHDPKWEAWRSIVDALKERGVDGV